jgi:hypothetical protein
MRSPAWARSGRDGGTARIAWIDRRHRLHRRARIWCFAPIIFRARTGRVRVRIVTRLCTRARLGRRNFAYDFIGRVRVRIPDDSNRDGTIVRLVRRRHLRKSRCNSRQRQDGKDQLLITMHASSHQSAGRPIISGSFLPRCHPGEKMACRRFPKQARKRAGDCSPAL